MPISIKQKNYIHSSPQTNKQDLNLKATELRLGLPGSESPERSINGGMKSLEAGAKRGFSDTINIGSSSFSPKTQVVGWPPIRSFRKNSMTQKNTKNEDDPNAESRSCVYVKVSMDGAPYLRKVDLKMYSSYLDLSLALKTMFSSFTLGQCESPLMNLTNGSEYVLTYEDKDGDLMLVGDVPWDMFTCSCKRMRIMKSSDTIGLAPRAVEECKSQN